MQVRTKGRMAEAILGLAFLWLFANGSLAFAQARLTPQQFQQQIQQQMQQMQQNMQLGPLLFQASDLQLQSVKLTLQIADLSPSKQAGTPGTQVVGNSQQAESPELKAALQAAADAKSACDDLKQDVLGSVRDTPQYKQIKAVLTDVRAALQRAQTATTDATPEMTDLANKEMAYETILSKQEQQALDAAPEWQAANAKLQTANKAVATIRANANNPLAQDPTTQQAATQADSTPSVQQIMAARMDAANATIECNSIKQNLLTALHSSYEYTHAVAALAAAKAQEARVQSAIGPSDNVVALAKKALADQAAITDMDLKVVTSSAAYKAANAKLQAPNKILAAAHLLDNQSDSINPIIAAIPITPPAASPQEAQAEIRDLTAQRAKIDAQTQATIEKIAGISSVMAEQASQSREGLLEELTQLHQQQLHPQANVPLSPDGAQLIHFSSEVPSREQQFLQGNLDEFERMKDPAYAAEKASEQQAETDLQQLQQAQEEAQQQQDQQNQQ